MAGPSLRSMAWRNLWRNPRRTVLTLLAISFGLFLATIFTGLQDRSFADMIDLSARMASGHVVVQDAAYQDAPSLKRTLVDAEAVADAVSGRPGVARAVPRVQGPAMLATAGRSYGAYVLAVDPAREDATTLAFVDALVDGRMLGPDDTKGVVLGVLLARNLKVGLGDKVVYTLLDKQGEIVSGLVRVTGLVRTGAEAADRGIAILPLDAARATLGYAPTEATHVAIYSDDARRSVAVRAEAAAVVAGTDDVALTWDEVNPELTSFIAMKVGGARFMEGVILVLVAASIFNTLFVSVLERRREFGIQLAIGYAPAQIFRLVLWESLWLALTGVVVGSALTAGPYFWLATHPIDLSEVYAQQGQSLDVAGVGMSPMLKIGIFPESFAVIVGGIVLSTLVAGLYPAWQAGRTVPVDTIKLV